MIQWNTLIFKILRHVCMDLYYLIQLILEHTALNIIWRYESKMTRLLFILLKQSLADIMNCTKMPYWVMHIHTHDFSDVGSTPWNDPWWRKEVRTGPWSRGRIPHLGTQIFFATAVGGKNICVHLAKEAAPPSRDTAYMKYTSGTDYQHLKICVPPFGISALSAYPLSQLNQNQLTCKRSNSTTIKL